MFWSNVYNVLSIPDILCYSFSPGRLQSLTLACVSDWCRMSMKLRASSGTYNVRASELARDKPIMKTVKCIVHFLDDSEAAFEIDVSITPLCSEVLFMSLCVLMVLCLSSVCFRLNCIAQFRFLITVEASELRMLGVLSIYHLWKLDIYFHVSVIMKFTLLISKLDLMILVHLYLIVETNYW